MKEFLRRHFWVLAVLLAGLFFAFALALSAKQQLWFDESYSIMVAKNDIPTIINLASVDIHPPLFYMILHFWGTIFGFSEFALRLLIIVFASTAIAVMIIFIKKVFGKKIALLSAPFLLVAPFFARYSFEVRMYAPAILVGVSATFAMWSAWRDKNKKLWLLYALLVAAGMYLTYMMALVFVAHAAWLIYVTVRAKNKPFFKHIFKQPWLLAYLGAVALYAPWISTALKHLSGNALSNVNTHFGFEQLVGFFSYSLLYTPTWQLKIWHVLAIAIVVIFTTIALITNPKKNRDSLLLFVTLTLVPIIMLVAMANPFFGKELYVERYIIVFVLFFYALIAIAASSFVVKKLKIAIAPYLFILAILTFGTVNLIGTGNFNFQRMDRSEGSVAATLLSEYCQDQIIVDDFYFYIELSPYMPENCHYYYYATEKVDFSGGWAPISLLDDRRIDDAAKITAEKVAIITPRNRDTNFFIPSKYTEIQELEISSLKIFFVKADELCVFDGKQCILE